MANVTRFRSLQRSLHTPLATRFTLPSWPDFCNPLHIMKTTTLQLRNSVNRLHVRLALLLIPLACFVLSPRAQAVDPPPDGGYPNRNTAEGTDALFNLDISQAFVSDNTATGFDALFTNTTGFGNTATGSQALYGNTTGGNNTADGVDALYFNTTGSGNTATGWTALQGNTTANFNTASGYAALSKNTTGEGNTANGALALFSNTIGINNTASGFNALEFNSTGSANTAMGFNALLFNINGVDNTATGSQALWGNAFGNDNTANGSSALFSNTSGNTNTAIGAGALYTNEIGSNNTAAGVNALYRNTGDNNIALGVSAGYNLHTGNNNIYIGNAGNRADNNKIRIGTIDSHKHTFIAGISGSTVAGGVGVIIDTDGHLGTTVSSARFKEDVKPMAKASEAILTLKPVTFRYTHEFDPAGIPQFGLVAEDVEKVDPDLVARDRNGKPYSVRYEAVNAMLLNEFLKEHRTVQEQREEIDALKAELKEQRWLIQKVSAQLELTKSAPQTVSDNQ
jgi:trimeric autotransporter adhesin